MRVLLVLAPVLALALDHWSLENPCSTTDTFVTSSIGLHTLVAFTNTRIFTSPVGSNKFTQVPYSLNGTGTALQWIDSCFWNNMSTFFAIGRYTSTASQNTLMVSTSPDGTNWNISNRFTLQWNYPSIACGNNEVFLSTGISVFQSVDGISWKTKTPLASFDRMNFVPQLGFYVGWSHALQSVFTSTPLREVWDVHVGPPKYPFSNIVHGKGIWVIAGTGFIYYSSNLAGFSVSNIPLDCAYTFRGLVYNPGLNAFVLAADNSSGAFIYQSTDGQHWNLKSNIKTPRVIETGVASGNATYLLGQTGMVVYSKDTVTFQVLSGPFWVTAQWVVWSDGQWWAPDEYGTMGEDASPTDPIVPIYTTNDGSTWTRFAQNASNCVRSFVRDPIQSKKTNTWIAFDGQYVYRSKNVYQWTSVFSAAFYNLNGLQSLYWDPSGSIALATGDGNRVDEMWISSDDAQTWKRILMSPTLMKLHHTLPVDTSTFLITQQDIWGTWFFISRDAGLTWFNTSSTVYQIESQWLTTSCCVMHVGGYNITVASKGDLATWTTMWNPAQASNPAWLVFQDTFYSIWRNATWSSTDGINWNVITNPYYMDEAMNFGPGDNAILAMGQNGVSMLGK